MSKFKKVPRRYSMKKLKRNYKNKKNNTKTKYTILKRRLTI